MLLRSSLDRARRLVAVLLLFGVFLAGSVDAVACEPLLEQASHSASATTDEDGGKTSSGAEKHGVCAHGHCHHGAQFVQAPVAASFVAISLPQYRAALSDPLVSPPGDGLKRPPKL